MQARISDADCAVAIILRALSGRVALYKIESWLEGLDMKVLFQSQPDPAFFNRRVTWGNLTPRCSQNRT